MSASAMAAVVEEYFKKFLIACEYMQIDPSKIHNQDFISQRIGVVLSQWDEKYDDPKDVKKINKLLKWFDKNYTWLIGKWYLFARRCERMMAKGQLTLAEGTVVSDYHKTQLTDQNYKTYYKVYSKQALIALGITLGILAVLGVLLWIFL